MVLHDFGTHMQRLDPHLLHKPWALDRAAEARIILDIGRDRELAARLYSLDQQRLQHGAGGVDRRRIASGSGPHDNEPRITLCHGAFLSPYPFVLHRKKSACKRFLQEERLKLRLQSAASAPAPLLLVKERFLICRFDLNHFL